ncbi:MAG: hypothetical protein IPK19_37860 [Chloroflexi bacterium]|nr:hypothetical protein [Chloroflexota bacterium]
MVFECVTDRGKSRASASPAGRGRWSSESPRIDDDGQVEHLTRLALRCDEETSALTPPASRSVIPVTPRTAPSPPATAV